jgi:predicted permease
VRLALNTDWRALGFGAGLACVVTLLFGLAPALRASAVKPVSALKGGEDPHARRRWMHSLVAVQMAFCVMVQFVAGLFVASFGRLSSRPLGFSAQHVLVMSTEIQGQKQPLNTWMQVTDHLRQTPGVESVSLAGWALLSGNGWTGSFRFPGDGGEARSPYMLDVTPGFFETMRIGLIAGRDFLPGDRAPAKVGIVNEAFARAYLKGENPVGKVVEQRKDKDASAPLEIIGYVRDASYRTVREAIRPTVYLPMGEKKAATILVRTAGDPRALAAGLRRAVRDARSEFRVREVSTQSAFVDQQLLRERLLATLSLFFAIVALVLAGIGLYGVLNYSVIQQRREIGIRMALGADAGAVARLVLAQSLAPVGIGAAAGLAGTIALARWMRALLFEVDAADPATLASVTALLVVVAMAAALAPARRASRIDPVEALRQ